MRATRVGRRESELWVAALGAGYLQLGGDAVSNANPRFSQGDTRLDGEIEILGYAG